MLLMIDQIRSGDHSHAPSACNDPGLQILAQRLEERRRTGRAAMQQHTPTDRPERSREHGSGRAHGEHDEASLVAGATAKVKIAASATAIAPDETAPDAHAPEERRVRDHESDRLAQ
ncbi:hypothetical protein, partial [Methylibium sp.]|uniref:hypothetical protein n=1 Tax=Methylibium sp. TaxID=2067992 RepID=UPI00286CC681